MRQHILSLSPLLVAALVAVSPGANAASVEPPAIEAGADAIAPAPVSELVAAVDIPYESFVLANGLTVLVHEDRRTPVVAVSVWYDVGSKHEPDGKTGFAHLFEHLMFNGSENAPGDFFEPLQQIGATDFNGTTWFDRTNYFQTVPTGALDRVLFLESDRMGHLLGAVTQEKLDNQIGVVQNEKRQGDNQPFGLVEYEQLETLYPPGHPYRHSTIGSMEDISGATLEDVRIWFRQHYGPNNAVLVLAGDIDIETAKEKVNHWFGAIPSGPDVEPVHAPVPTLPAPVSKTMKDQVATTRIYRMWAIPGIDNPDSVPLQMAGSVLGGLASSRLDSNLVRGQQLAVAVRASAYVFAQAGQFVVLADLKPGVPLEELEAALDAEIAAMIAEGPTQEELQRAATSYAASEIRGLDSLGGFAGKAPTLAQGLLYAGDPEYYQKTLARAASLTPEEVKAVTAQWLSRPVFKLTVEPGPRTESGEGRGGYRAEADGSVPRPAYYADPVLAASVIPPPQSAPDRAELPPVGEPGELDFPEIERAQLANGLEIYFARRAGIPAITAQLSFDAGFAADPGDALGIQSLMLQTMDAGTSTLDATELAIAQERLGASIIPVAGRDTTAFVLSAVAPNLAPSFALLADYVRNPAFDPQELERVRAQQLTRIRSELTDPRGIGLRAFYPLVYGASHPYGAPPSGLGVAEAVERLSPAELEAFHDRWLRPDMARLYVAGDTTLEEVVQLANQSFGDWQAPAAPRPEKNFDAQIPSQTSRIVLIDRPASPQSVILAGRVLDIMGTDDLVTLEAANDVLGGSFLSRLNMDLRETKGWSYGVRSGISMPKDRAVFTIHAPVQTDRTGESIAALRENLAAFLGPEGVTEAELQRTVNGAIRELPGRFESSRGVLAGLVDIVEFERPADYYETLDEKYQDMTPAGLDEAIRAENIADDLVFVVVGDRQEVEPQLRELGLPFEVREVEE